MIKKLFNPKTELYQAFKEFVTGSEFPWIWIDEKKLKLNTQKGHQDLGYYMHVFLQTPSQGSFYPKPVCTNVDYAVNLFLEIAKENKIETKVIYRIAANCVHSSNSMMYSVVHEDHDYPHKVMLVYLTDPNGGDTMCEGESFLGLEDDIVILEGKHCHRPPIDGRRIVLVYTFLDNELSCRLQK